MHIYAMHTLRSLGPRRTSTLDAVRPKCQIKVRIPTGPQLHAYGIAHTTLECILCEKALTPQNPLYCGEAGEWRATEGKRAGDAIFGTATAPWPVSVIPPWPLCTETTPWPVSVVPPWPLHHASWLGFQECLSRTEKLSLVACQVPSSGPRGFADIFQSRERQWCKLHRWRMHCFTQVVCISPQHWNMHAIVDMNWYIPLAEVPRRKFTHHDEYYHMDAHA